MPSLHQEVRYLRLAAWFYLSRYRAQLGGSNSRLPGKMPSNSFNSYRSVSRLSIFDHCGRVDRSADVLIFMYEM